MKKLKLFFLSIIFCTTLNSQVPVSFNVTAGNGAIGYLGAEAEISRFSLAVGWRPVGTIYPNQRIESYNAAFTVFSNELGGIKYNEPGVRNYLYFSSTYASEGTLQKDLNENGLYHPMPAIFLMAGLRTFFFPEINRLSFKIGAGININQDESRFAFEFMVNFKLFNNKYNTKFKCE